MNRCRWCRIGYEEVGVTLVILGVLLAGYGIWQPYSFWFDELFSVSAASSPLRVMFVDFILPDVHPPLYQLILKGWIGLFSSGEAVTRLLSLIFTLASLVMLWIWGSKRLSRIGLTGVLVVYATNPLFIYYAQEVRSYALMLLVSLMVTLLLVDIPGEGVSSLKGGMLLVAGLFLSLIHYFGWIYYGVTVFYLLYLSLRQKDFRGTGRVVVFGLLALAWPVWHFVRGGLGEKTGGNFWIVSRGWSSTLETISQALFPQISAGFKELLNIENPLPAALAFVLVMGLISWISLKGRPGKDIFRGEVALGGVLFAGLAMMGVLLVMDHYTPLSTVRNYIVLLPMIALVTGRALERIHKASGTGALLLLLLLAFTNLGGFLYYHTSLEGRPVTEDHRGAAAFVVRSLVKEPAILYYPSGENDFERAREGMIRFYLEKLAPGEDFRIQGVALEEILELEPPYLLVIQHSEADVQRSRELYETSDRVFETFIPEQRGGGTVVYEVKE